MENEQENQTLGNTNKIKPTAAGVQVRVSSNGSGQGDKFGSKDLSNSNNKKFGNINRILLAVCLLILIILVSFWVVKKTKNFSMVQTHPAIVPAVQPDQQNYIATVLTNSKISDNLSDEITQEKQIDRGTLPAELSFIFVGTATNDIIEAVNFKNGKSGYRLRYTSDLTPADFFKKFSLPNGWDLKAAQANSGLGAGLIYAESLNANIQITVTVSNNQTAITATEIKK